MPFDITESLIVQIVETWIRDSFVLLMNECGLMFYSVTYDNVVSLNYQLYTDGGWFFIEDNSYLELLNALLKKKTSSPQEDEQEHHPLQQQVIIDQILFTC